VYEIIREHRPCHLYFDLEFPRCTGCNADVDGDALVQALVAVLQSALQAWLGVTLRPEQHVLELDSTTRTKFSRHLIVSKGRGKGRPLSRGKQRDLQACLPARSPALPVL
jgi:hypothetical protein